MTEVFEPGWKLMRAPRVSQLHASLRRYHADPGYRQIS
jgi:hypothetical protein